MNEEAFFWLILNIASIAVLSFYSMMEMACVSFNRVRLQYYVADGNQAAKKILYLLQQSARLFGTTLIGVNVAMIFGSEFSRQFHAALGVSPDWAPLSQVMIVIIFGELAPMFAARRYSEHTALLGANLLYLSAILMRPLLWIIQLITTFSHKIIGGEDETFNIYMNQEEIKKILEERPEEHPARGSAEELNAIISNIFTLREKTAGIIMRPLRTFPLIPSNYSIGQMRHALIRSAEPFVLVYHRKIANVVGIAFPRDILRLADNKRVGDYAKSCWFIDKKMELVHVLQQFRSNQQSVAVILDKGGEAAGVLTLDDVLEEIFGRKSPLGPSFDQKNLPIIERTFTGDTKVAEFNQAYGVSMEALPEETLAELVTRLIGHNPEEGETVTVGSFELRVKEATLLEIKLITIKTKIG